MKKLIFAVVFIALFTLGSPVFAQRIPEEMESDLYYVNLTLDRIWPAREGYIVQYRKGFYRHGRAFLPFDWFTDVSGRGEIITLPRGRSWPSMSVFYVNGEFSHVRLYVHRLQTHRTWGNVPQYRSFEGEFDNLQQTLDLEFR